MEAESVDAGKLIVVNIGNDGEVDGSKSSESKESIEFERSGTVEVEIGATKVEVGVGGGESKEL